jgi:uncharacterized protein (TIGR03437 family)
MRLAGFLFCSALAIYGQPGCPTVTFPAVSSAPLSSSSSTHRILLKQPDGSYTAFELSNAPPFNLLRTIPHFENQLSPCVPGTTGLNSFTVLGLAQLATGGVLIATDGQSGGTDIAEFDAGMHLLSEAHYTALPVSQFADVNGDGILDAIGVTDRDYNPTISVALGTGGTGFKPPVSIVIPVSISDMGIGAIAVADVNGDHNADLVALTGGGSGGQLLLFPGNGDGTFQPPSILFTALFSSSVLAIADLNGDGKPDLVFGDTDPTTYSAVMRVALNMGGGTFAMPVGYAVGAISSVTIGDVNGDGIPDIVTNGTILINDGTGKFPTRRDILLDTTNNVARTNLIVADFNGDGIPDLIVAQGTSAVMAGDSVSVLYGQGKLAFPAPVLTPSPNPANSDEEFTALTTADVNGDGIPDLLTADNFGHITVFIGVGDGSFQVASRYSLVPNQIPWGFAIGDFNNDGKTDFAVVASGYQSTSVGEADIFLGNGDGTFHSAPQIAAPLGAFALATGDFNGDGKTDLALLVTQEGSGTSDSVIIEKGAGDGTFSAGAIYPVGPVSNAIVATDFNGDGKLDLVVTNAGTNAKQSLDGGITLLTGKGDGTFAASNIAFVGGTGRAPLGVAAADFNGDGKIDLAVTLSSISYYLGGLAIFIGRGDGTFQTPVIYSAEAFAVRVADINGDGIPDLLLSGSNDTQGPGLQYMLGNGDGSFQPQIPVNPNVNSPYPLAIADFNRDGTLDIVAFTPESIATFLNTTHVAPPVRLVSAASLIPGPLAPDSIVTAFGKNLPSSNASVQVQDSTGASYPATIFYSSPTEVNFVIPAQAAVGPATISLGTQTAATVLVSEAPSIFAFNAQGLAAAYVTRASGATEPVYQLVNGVYAAVPIDVSAGAGPAYLILFGTGLRNGGAVQARAEDMGFVVEYAGPQPAIPGLDQVNILLPPSLSGSGLLNLTLTAGGLPANTVYVVIK